MNRIKKNSTINTAQCRRCGLCCQKNSPSLHLADLNEIQAGNIPKDHLITYRKGEWVNDNVAGQLIQLKQDMIKPIENNINGFCIFYIPNNQSCRIYDSRFLECKLQDCYNPDALKKVYSRDRLTRRDIFSLTSAAYEFIEYHESKCPLDELENLSPSSNHQLSEQQKSYFREIIRFEYHFRYTLHERTGLNTKEMNFLLGRPLETILKQMSITF